MLSTKLVSLVLLAAAVNAEYWIFGGLKPIVTTRLDPVISPNEVSSHVHSVVGASRFKSVYDPVDLLQSNCTTVPVQPDKSNYWAPQLYHQDQQTGQFTPIPTSFNIYYLVRPGPGNAAVKAFPPGLRMVAGNTNRRTYNASSFADQAIDFVCMDFTTDHAGDPDWDERPSFFDHNCPDGLRAQVFFPSCWDGVNLDAPDHQSHMAYPIQNFNDGDCPDTHPVHLVSLFYEMITSVDKFDYWGPGTWVLANGDTTGLGHHGDFTNGWDVDLLQDAIDHCPDANGNVMDCPALAAAFDQQSADACVLETQIVNEEVGLHGPLDELAGCNPLWNGTTGPRPSCAANLTIPALVPVQTSLPTNWTEIGCVAEGPNGRALTGASTTSPTMTRATCVSFCQEKGFGLAGVEYSDECYCDNEMRNAATNTTVMWNECTNHCAGNVNEICGGPNRLTLMFTSNPPSLPTQGLPAGWTALGCLSDNSTRALTGYGFSSNQMTIDSCLSTCASHGLPLAGIEYGSECYCGASFENGLGTPIDEATCSMGCSGDSSSTCGGSWALTAFRSKNTSGVAPSSTSAPSISVFSSATSAPPTSSSSDSELSAAISSSSDAPPTTFSGATSSSLFSASFAGTSAADSSSSAASLSSAAGPARRYYSPRRL
ncbi:WSC-domain-containing protein [Polyporus arcularius HHB13444]|uniref:WSC-domain-containing protein n=1 Tax=Polyporus arcularius HHB13444 TaxID=1314778 RepID=A0A5C3P1K1_9APHY|nr:WSC-domain-containing protein [Polyporus arcularius HHB13444]